MSVWSWLTGQPSTRELIHDLLRVQAQIATRLAVQTGLLHENRNQLANLEESMSELDSSTDELTVAVNDLLDAYDPAPTQELLRQIAEKNAEIARVTADDEADKGQIAALAAERDALLADVEENVGKQAELKERVRAVVPEAPAEPAEPAEPVVTEPGTAEPDVEEQGGPAVIEPAAGDVRAPADLPADER